MTISPALQLYTVREQLAKDFAGTIRKIASYGYRAVETAGFGDGGPQAAKALFDELGLKVVASHSGLPIGDDKNQILDTVKLMESPYIICAWLDPATYYSNLDGIKQACEMLNQANEHVQAAGLKLAYHNHWFELAIIAGKPAYQHMLDYLEPEISFELDTYWIQVGGQDPVQVIKELGQRAALLHLKDGPANGTEAAMTALGTGAIDIPAILAASQAEAHIVELDRCNTDMMQAVQESFNYLKGLES
jgi:sugar phosphate isomerase/epimerase